MNEFWLLASFLIFIALLFAWIPWLKIRNNILAPFLITGIVAIGSIIVYLQVGSIDDYTETVNLKSSNPQDRISALKARSQRVPEDVSTWYSLGQLYTESGNYELALPAYDEAIKLENNNATLLAAKAQTLFYQADESLTEEAKKLVEKSLEINPNNATANILVGMDNFLKQNFELAMSHWKTALHQLPEGDERVILEEALHAAQQRLGDDIVQLKVIVTIADDIKANLSETDTIFVYASPVDQKMPLVAKRVPATKKIPFEISLSELDVMIPGVSLSQHEALDIRVLISKNGEAIQREGDLLGVATAINITQKEPTLIIVDSLVGGNKLQESQHESNIIAKTLAVTLTISEQLQTQLAQEDWVYLFASAEHSPQPLAVTRIAASHLPTKIELTDAMGISTENLLSDATTVSVFAVVKKGENEGFGVGDLQGKVENLNFINSTSIELVINEVIQ